MFFPALGNFLCTMGMIYIMLIVSLCLAVFFLVIFLWAAKTGQYDDDYSPSVRILFEEEKAELSNHNQNKAKKDGTTNSKIRQ